MNRLVSAVVLSLCLSFMAYAQPRPVTQTAKSGPPKTAPESFSAKYEGGMLGFTAKEAGTLKFEDVNSRLVFFGKAGKELFAIPYDSLLVIYPQSQSVTSTAGNVVKYIPLPGASLAGFIKEKRQYLIVQYDDPNIDVKGTTNFKIENKELLDAVLETLAAKANLTQRGDAYYRPKAVKPGT